MLASVITLALAVAPVRLAAPGFGHKGVPQSDADFYLDAFAQQLKSADLTVTTPADIQSLLGIERQKQLLGCDEDSTSCAAELAAALGVDGVVRGSIGLIEGTWFVNFTVIALPQGAELASFTASTSSEKELIATLGRAAQRLREAVLERLRPELTGGQTSSRRVLAAVPLGVGLVTGIIGAALLGTSESKAGALQRKDAAAVSTPAEEFAASVKRDRLVGQLLIGAAAVAIVAAAVVFFLLADRPVSATTSVTASIASLLLTGRYP